MSNQLPSEETALELLVHAGCSPNVVEHCKIVADFAVEIAEACKRKGLRVDVELVRIGALLHDIGRANTHKAKHGVVGAQIAASLNLPPSVISIIERHVGSGITKDEAERLRWPAKSYVPQLLEERIVAYTDKLVEGSRKMPFEKALDRFSRDKATSVEDVERLKQWHKVFSSCQGPE